MLQRLRIPLFLVAALLFGFKAYIIYRFVFDLSIENTMQEMILFINPFATAIVLFSFAALMKPKRQKKYIKYLSLSGAILLFANLVYYRNFTDFITLPSILQFKNFADLGASTASSVKIWDIFLFADTLLIFYLARKSNNDLVFTYKRKSKLAIIALSFSLLLTNFVLAEIERPMLFKRGFDREYLVKNVGLVSYHIYDAIINSKTKVQKVMADGSKLSEIEKYVDQNVDDTTSSDLRGIAKDKNIIYISAESVQNFVINRKVNGEEITPFLNDLIKDSYYFNNFYHQVNLGRTSDSEFLVENSLYPLPNGSVFFTHGQNEYNGVPEIVNEHGYYSSVFHANNKSFWNRDVAYESLGYDQFYSQRYFNVNEENTIGWGLSDKAFFDQSMKYLKSMPQPFYTKFITLTNHHPYELDEKYASIDQFDSNSKTLNQYFPTVRYTDEAIEQFFNNLKESGLYEDSIIIIYGDHFGISENHNKAMGQYLNKEITPYDTVQLQRVPLIIHIPGHEDDRVIEKVTGQIDLKPTVLNMMGIKNEEDIMFGNDLFADKPKRFVAFRDGDFVTEDYVYTKNTCYDRESGEEVDGSFCEPTKDQVLKELNYSDQLIYEDLFRFQNTDSNSADKENKE
ncbi:Phosphoglycerol transferase MdoB [Salinibacillus kushneri]|uniref:Phosphoglycerol transferase MdoB n=1 Tax=Salinibacillus kushneri TaxID=237682 RepID=A0A1I0FVN9_9BACI|nr:LTA synthase family protein [Salinibacillus kushneri]SET62481.1 Phosphoglycerol transferase MdoB [Salinibacillus kushneri]